MTTAFKRRVRAAVGGDTLGGNYYRFLLVHTGYIIFTQLPNIFINTFLMSQTDSIEVVLVYNVLAYFGSAFGMFFSAAAVHRFHPGVAAVIGILGNDLLYLELILTNTQAAQYVVLIGITSGLAGAFYWISYSQLLTEFTELNNRDSGLAIISMMTSVVNVIVPLVAGAVISGVGGNAGYNAVFGIAFVIGLITAFGAVRLPKPKTGTQGVHYLETFRFSLAHKAVLWGQVSEGFKGIREGAFSFILSILLFRLIQSEMLIGFNTFLSSAASILSYLFISKRIQGNNRIRYMEIATAGLLFSGIAAVLAVNPAVLIGYTVVNAFFSGFLVNSSFSTFLDAIQAYPETKRIRPELFAQKELFLAIGRCLGILLILVINRISGSNLYWLAGSLILLTLSQAGTVTSCRRVERHLNSHA